MMPAAESHGSACVRVKSKKGALRTLGYDSNSKRKDVVHAFTITRDRGLDGGMESVVGDRQGRPGSIIAGGIDRVLPGEGRTYASGVLGLHHVEYALLWNQKSTGFSTAALWK
jgi:hypothetical protein